MKLVINTCYGGFGLSHEAVMEYARLKDIKLHAYVNQRKPDGGIMVNQFEPYAGQVRPFCIHYSTAKLKAGKLSNRGYFSTRSIARTDPVLVQVVEKMKASANGECAKLRVVEIPDGVEWELDEYDGMEVVRECSRSGS